MALRAERASRSSGRGARRDLSRSWGKALRRFVPQRQRPQLFYVTLRFPKSSVPLARRRLLVSERKLRNTSLTHYPEVIVQNPAILSESPNVGARSPGRAANGSELNSAPLRCAPGSQGRYGRCRGPCLRPAELRERSELRAGEEGPEPDLCAPFISFWAHFVCNSRTAEQRGRAIARLEVSYSC